MGQIDLTRIDAALIAGSEFEPHFESWLSALVDTINSNLQVFQDSFTTGVATLAGGTVSVPFPTIVATDSIFLNLTNAVLLGTITTTIVINPPTFTGFTIDSTNGADASTFSYMVVKF